MGKNNFKQNYNQNVKPVENTDETPVVDEVEATEPNTEVIDDVQETESTNVTANEPTSELTEIQLPLENKGDVIGDTVATETIDNLADLYKVLHTIEVDDLTNVLSITVPKDDAETLFVAELKDINKYLIANTNDDINKANLRLNALILNVLAAKDALRFNIINIIFKLDNVRFEPSNLLRVIAFTKTASVIQNYSQLISIIETLADPETRKAKKATVSNLTYLTIPADSKEFLKQYYKI